MTAYHVYVDYKPDGTPFYVGKGTRHRVTYRQRNKWHTSITDKYPDWYRKVVETAPEALCHELEEFLISEIGRRDLGLGPLVNLTNGGDGVSGLRHSQETKDKCREIQKGEKGFWYGKTLSIETRRKIGIKSAQRVNPMLGKKHTVETLAKISAALTGKKLSEETKKKMGVSRKGKKRSPEACAAISRGKIGSKGTNTGSVGMNNGTTYKFVPLIEIETYTNNGWVKGQIKK